MADSALKVVGTAIYTMLSGSTDVMNIIQDHGIWLGAAVSKTAVPLPYVVFNWMAGGELNSNPQSTFDIWMLVTGISNDLSEAMNLSDAIRTALKDKEPTYSDNYKPFAPVTELTPFLDRNNIEGVQYWRVGATYRFRGTQE